MYDYKLFLESQIPTSWNPTPVEGNLNESEEAVAKAIEEGKIKVGNKFYQAPGGSWRFNRSTGFMDFDVDVAVVDGVEGSLKDLGFTFGKIKGDFDCSGLSIKNLEGSPESCKSFIAGDSDLKSLVGSPYAVENFDVNNCLIGSLKGSPRFVFGDFNLSNNMITDLSGGPLLISGTINLLGNGYPHDFKLFKNMHKFIMEEYMNVTPKNAIKDIEKALYDNEYFAKILSSDLNYIQFIKEYDNADLAEGILKMKPSESLLSSIRTNLPLVWEEIIKINRGDSGHDVIADLGDLGF